MLWENLRCDEFKAAVEKSNGVCAIPIGCVEAHGIHLPLGCDTLKAREFCIRAAEQEPVVVFPSFYFGEKSGAGEFPGTIVLPTPLIVELLEACCKEIYRNGFKKIVLVSSHGGNGNMLNYFNRAMLEKQPEILVYHYYQSMAYPDKVLADLESFPYLTEEDIAILQSFTDAGKRDGHGALWRPAACTMCARSWWIFPRWTPSAALPPICLTASRKIRSLPPLPGWQTIPIPILLICTTVSMSGSPRPLRQKLWRAPPRPLNSSGKRLSLKNTTSSGLPSGSKKNTKNTSIFREYPVK